LFDYLTYKVQILCNMAPAVPLLHDPDNTDIPHFVVPFRIGSSKDGTITKQVVTIVKGLVYFLGNMARSKEATKFTSKLPAGTAWDDVLNHSTLDKFAALGREERESFIKAIPLVFLDSSLAWIRDDASVTRNWTDVDMHEPMKLGSMYRKSPDPPSRAFMASWSCPSLDAVASGP